MKSLSKSEADTLYRHLATSPCPRDLAIRLLFETGARVTEALTLVGGSLSKDILDITPLKGSLPRRVQVTPELAARLQEILSAVTPDTPLGAALFPGTARSSWRRLLCRHYHALTLRLFGHRRHLHGLRHTAFTRVYRATQDLLLTKSWAGHAAIGSTVVYMEAVAQDRGSAVNLAALKL